MSKQIISNLFKDEMTDKLFSHISCTSIKMCKQIKFFFSNIAILETI